MKNQESKELLSLSQFRNFVKDLKKDLQEEIDSDAEYEGQGDLMMGAILNAEEGLAAIKDWDKAAPRQQARVLADVTLLQRMLEEFANEEGDDDDLSDFDEEDEE